MAVEYPEVVRRRRMVRDYDPDRPVPPEVVSRLLGYAVHAPSAGFSQGWAFLVLATAAERAAFWDATTPVPADGGPRPPTRWLAGMRRAPLIVVAHTSRELYLDRYAEPDKGWTDRDPARWPVPYWYVDAGFASLLILLGAVDEGLGACFFGIPAERVGRYRQVFGVPDGQTPVGAITIGYRAPDRPSPSLGRGRRPLADVVHMGRWGRPYPESREPDTKAEPGGAGGESGDS